MNQKFDTVTKCTVGGFVWQCEAAYGPQSVRLNVSIGIGDRDSMKTLPEISVSSDKQTAGPIPKKYVITEPVGHDQIKPSVVVEVAYSDRLGPPGSIIARGGG